MERRLSERVAIDRPVACRIPATLAWARMLDVSRTGCRVSFADKRPQTGGTISVDVGTGRPLSGEVVWLKGRESGVHFTSAPTFAQAVQLGLEEVPVTVEEAVDEWVAPSLSARIGHWFRRVAGTTRLFDQA